MKKSLTFIALCACLFVAPAIACDETIDCSIDGAIMVKTREDVANGRVIATYEHKTAAGNIHRATKACN